MSQTLLVTISILIGGAFAALQSPTNALLAQAFRSPLSAALASFLVGSTALAVAVASTRAAMDWGAAKALPWYAWLGGLYGAWFVVAAAFGAPKIGVTNLVVLFLVGQIAMSLVIDQFGLIGVPQRPISLERTLGLVLVIAGVWLVRRS